MTNKFTQKIKKGAKTVVTGQDGSILDAIGRFLLFCKEFIMAINERMEMRRNEKANKEKNGE